MRARTLVLLGLVPAVAACDRDQPFGPATTAEASITVGAFYDYDGQPGPSGNDQAAPGLRFQVTLPGSGTAVAEGVTDTTGVLTLDRIPVGTYDLRVDPAFLGDSLVLSQIDTTRVTLAPNDALAIAVGVTPPSATIAEARGLPQGRRVWVEGLALNARGESVDRAIHLLAGDGSAIRVTFPAAVPGSAGDSLRVLGRTSGTGDGRFLTDGRVIVLADQVRAVLPLEVTAARARTADGGALDARFVVVQDATVTEVATVPFAGTLLTIDDGTGSFRALLLTQNGFGQAVVPGTPVLGIAGLLVPDPDAGGTWRLVPRGGGDVEFGQPPGGA